MRKYYYKDENGQQQGPIKLDLLKTKNLKPESPVWYDPLPKWTTAGQVEELKSLFPVVVTTPVAEVKEAVAETTAAATVVQPEVQPVTETVKPVETVQPVAEVKQAEPVQPVVEVKPEPESVTVTPKAEAMEMPPDPVVVPEEKKVMPEVKAAVPEVKTVVPEVQPVVTAAAPAAAAVATPAAKPVAVKKKGPAWVSALIAILALGGAGFWAYYNVEMRDKSEGPATENFQNDNQENNNANTDEQNNRNDQEENAKPDDNQNNNTDENVNQGASGENMNGNSAPNANTPAVPATTNTTPVATSTPTAKPVSTSPAKPGTDPKSVAAKKADDEKKKQQAAQKLLDDQQKAKAAAASANEARLRNNWPSYVTIGKLGYTPGDNIDPFDIPVYNAYDVPLDKVVVRVDYMRKEKKVLGTETLTFTNIPAKSGRTLKAEGSKRGNNVHVYITEIQSRRMHFCFPQNGGNAADPYYCN